VPSNDKYQAVEEYVTRRDIAIRIPEHVAEEFGESPDAYRYQRDRLRSAQDAGLTSLTNRIAVSRFLVSLRLADLFDPSGRQRGYARDVETDRHGMATETKIPRVSTLWHDDQPPGD